MSILLLSSTVASRFCNLLIMLAYVDIRLDRDMELG